MDRIEAIQKKNGNRYPERAAELNKELAARLAKIGRPGKKGTARNRGQNSRSNISTGSRGSNKLADNVFKARLNKLTRRFIETPAAPFSRQRK